MTRTQGVAQPDAAGTRRATGVAQEVGRCKQALVEGGASGGTRNPGWLGSKPPSWGRQNNWSYHVESSLNARLDSGFYIQEAKSGSHRTTHSTQSSRRESGLEGTKTWAGQKEAVGHPPAGTRPAPKHPLCRERQQTQAGRSSTSSPAGPWASREKNMGQVGRNIPTLNPNVALVVLNGNSQAFMIKDRGTY